MALRASRKLMNAIMVAQEELNDENDDENDKDFTIADEDRLMTHMMDCFSLLAAIQKQEQQVDISVDIADARMVRNKVFMGALSVLGNSLLKVDGMVPSNAAISNLTEAFPVPYYKNYLFENEDRGWLPLHWALALLRLQPHNVTEVDVKKLYALDPMAMQAKHIDKNWIMGLTPAHILCLIPATPISMKLVRSFSLCSPTAFGSATTVSALHVTCRYGTPTVELLQHLLQLDSSQTKIETQINRSFVDHCPLGELCSNLVKRADELPNAEELVKCLLEVDQSKEVVGDALVSCLLDYTVTNTDADADAVCNDKAAPEMRNSRVYRMIESLLMAKPEAATYQESNGSNLLHLATVKRFAPKLCIDFMKLVLHFHKDAVREVDDEGRLPAHRAAACSDVEVLTFLLNLRPEAASAVTSKQENLLHVAIEDSVPDRAVPKVRYLCARYPAMMQKRDIYGLMPAHVVTYHNENYKALLALYEAGGLDQFKTPVAHPTEADIVFNGYLPLHVFVHLQVDLDYSDSSGPIEMLRSLLRIYPEAAGIKVAVDDDEKTPYQIAVDQELPDSYLRLLLRAAPTLNPPELHRLNYEQRRMAMFLAFKAITATMEVPLLVRLRGESKDLVRRVVSFL